MQDPLTGQFASAGPSPLQSNSCFNYQMVSPQLRLVVFTHSPHKPILEKRRFAAMSITLEIRPEVQAGLSRQASLSGRDLAGYMVDLLEAAVHPPLLKQDPDFGRRLVEAFAMVRCLTDDVDFSRDRSTEWR